MERGPVGPRRGSGRRASAISLAGSPFTPRTWSARSTSTTSATPAAAAAAAALAGMSVVGKGASVTSTRARAARSRSAMASASSSGLMASARPAASAPHSAKCASGRFGST